MTRPVDDGKGHRLITVGVQQYWLVKAFWMLPAAMALVACSAGEPATAPQASVPTPTAAAAPTLSLCAGRSAQRHSYGEADEQAQTATPDLGAGLDQQEVRRSQPQARSAGRELRRVQALHHHLPR